MNRLFAILIILICSASSAPAAPSAPKEQKDLYFGEALYYAFQGDWFAVISRLDTELIQHYGVDEPELDKTVTQHTHHPSHVPDLLLERYRLGEMSPAEIERIRRCLATDEKLRARLRALDDSNEEIGPRYPSGWLAARIRQRLRADAPQPCPSVGRRSFGWRLPVAVAAVAVVVLGVGLRFLGPLQPLPAWMTSHSGEQADRLKGGSLVLFRKTAAGSEVLGDEARVRAGDQIRIGYRAAGRSYGLILSIDGRGVVTRHFPKQGEQAALLTHDGLVLLDHAFELDKNEHGPYFGR